MSAIHFYYRVAGNVRSFKTWYITPFLKVNYHTDYEKLKHKNN